MESEFSKKPEEKQVLGVIEDAELWVFDEEGNAKDQEKEEE